MVRHAWVMGFLVVASCLLFWPSSVAAQSGISGLVTDSSGAVLPGVTLEAASPGVIETSKAAVTVAHVRYSVIDLRPGVYSVTFSLTGFNAVKRDQIELPADFTANVSIQLQVGALQETVTVSAQSPVVD